MWIFKVWLNLHQIPTKPFNIFISITVCDLMTNELVVIYSKGDDGVVLIKNRLCKNWKKKDLKKAAKKGYIAGYNKSEPDAYFVIPMSNVDCLTICEGDIHNSIGDKMGCECGDCADDGCDEKFRGSKPNPDEKMFG